MLLTSGSSAYQSEDSAFYISFKTPPVLQILEGKKELCNFFVVIWTTAPACGRGLHLDGL